MNMSMSRISLIRPVLLVMSVVTGFSFIAQAGSSSYRYDRMFRDEGRSLIIGVYRDQLTDIRRERQQLVEEGNEDDITHERQQQIAQEIHLLDARAQDVMRLIQEISPARNQGAGTVIARGLAGSHNFDYLDDVKIDGTLDGFKQGLAVRTADAFGKVMGSRIEAAFENVLGGTCDFMLTYFMDLWRDMTEIFFHSGKEPFYPEILNEWLKLIRVSLEDIERMMKDGLKESLRGYGMAKRKFGGDFAGLLDDKEGIAVVSETDVQEQESALDIVWCDLISGYADQFERLCDEIDHRMGYYDDNSMEVFYANQIKKRLQNFKNILLESKSLADLDSKLHSNKSLIPAVRKNTENLFERLMVMVTPKTYSTLTSGESSSSLFDRANKKSSGYSVKNKSDGFPHGFSQGSGF